jgi:flagellin
MTVDSIAKSQMGDIMMKLSAMKRINSAADDAAGLAIAEKIETQIRGLEKGSDNTLDMKNLAKTAEGGLSVIDDSLQRIRELGVQAKNGTYTDEDRALMQMEVDQLVDGINQIAKGTEFNNQALLDGSFQNRNTASSPSGTGALVSIPDMSAAALGIGAFDVTKADFDLRDVDKAISSVNTARSYLGSMENRFDYTVSSNSITMLNQAAAKSLIADLDVAKGVNDLNRERILNDTRVFMQKNQQESAVSSLSLLV